MSPEIVESESDLKEVMFVNSNNCLGAELRI